MDDAEYRRLCSAPDVLRRPDVRATLVRLRERAPRLADELDRLLRSAPVPKPIGHEGGSDTDYLWLDLSRNDVESIHDALIDLEVELAQDPAADPATLSWAASLADKWRGVESARPDVI